MLKEQSESVKKLKNVKIRKSSLFSISFLFERYFGLVINYLKVNKIIKPQMTGRR